MYDYKSGFPNNVTDTLVDIEDIRGNTNFSHMGETNGIEIKCTVKFKVKTENILMDPDWEMEDFTEKFKERFKHGYFVFNEERYECIQYLFYVDYDTNSQKFNLVHVKRQNLPQKNYLNAIQNRYDKHHIEDFEKWLVQFIIKNNVKKSYFKT